MYTDFYNLESMPFQLTPDPSFYYGSAGHKRVLSYLQYGVHQGEGFIVVTGDIGTGKTTLTNTLLDELKKETSIVTGLLVSTQLESDDLLRMVSSIYGLEYEGLSKPSLLKNLETFFKKQSAEGKRVLLIVDEAQNLPIKSLEELRMLSNYQEDNKALFQSFLVGQEEFRNVLKIDYLEQLRQRIIASYHLGPLDSKDTKVYIEHRLTKAGWKNNPKITKNAYAAVYDYTAGVPRRINTLMDRAFLVGSLQEATTISEEVVKNVIDELNDEVLGSGNSDPDISLVKESKTISLKSPLSSEVKGLEERVARLEAIIEKMSDAFSNATASTSPKKFKK